MEFSKFLILIDYLLMIGVVVLCYFNPELTPIAIGWASQLAISTGFYFWKARLENKVKLPLFLLKSLPPDIRQEMDLTEVIKSIIGGNE